jgi:hypothetical protein
MLTRTLKITAAALAIGAAALSTQASAQCDPVPGMIIGGGIGAAIGNAPGAAVGAILGSAISSSGPCYYGPRAGYYEGPRNYERPRYSAPPPAAYYDAPPAQYAPQPAYYGPPPVAYYQPAPVYYAPPVYYGPSFVIGSYGRGYRHYARGHHRRW